MSDANREFQVKALLTISEATTEMVWLMNWLSSMTDDLNTAWRQINDEAKEHPRAREFLDELADRRKTHIALNSVAREVGL